MSHPAAPLPEPRDTDILTSMRRRIEALRLDLRGFLVVTEAATGAYACTAPLAAMAGARVHAVARDTARHGSFEDARRATMALADAAGVADRISIGRSIPPQLLSTCDILTNSGHLRPITADLIARLPHHAVIALMFEAWEFRAADLDLDACRQRGIRIAAVNERHPDVAVFPFLGPLAARLLEDAGITLDGARITLLCDNPFAPFIDAGLRAAGARVATWASIDAVPTDLPTPDAVLVALDPARNDELGQPHLRKLAARAHGAVLAQFWGDIDRVAAGLVWPGRIWPPRAPGRGHMAVLLSDLGHEPIVRLQAGGLRAAELVARGSALEGEGIAELLTESVRPVDCELRDIHSRVGNAPKSTAIQG